MAFALPKGLPSLIDVTGFLATPESQFEKMVKNTLNFKLPPGPQKMLLNLQESLETGGKPELPGFPETPELENVLAKLPSLPKLPLSESIINDGIDRARDKLKSRVAEGGPPPKPLTKNSTPSPAKRPKTGLVSYRLTK